MNENLEQKFSRYKALIDNLPCIALILKKETREIVASNKIAIERGAVPGKTCYETCAQRDDNCPFCLAPEVWNTGKPRQLEVEYMGKHYIGIWVSLAEDLYAHYIFDITERKRAENAIKNKVNELEAMNKIMIDREMRHIELKKEINKLLKELGRPPKFSV